MFFASLGNLLKVERWYSVLEFSLPYYIGQFLIHFSHCGLGHMYPFNTPHPTRFFHNCILHLSHGCRDRIS